MRGLSTINAEVLAISALTETISDERRARRFLDLSGIDTEELRRRAGETALLAAVLRFLEAHEPDLIDVAAALDVKPEQLVAAREVLEA
jgi:hypothetical protein